MNSSHLLTALLAGAVVLLASGAEASPHLPAPTLSPLPLQAGSKCGLVNGRIVCGNANGSGKHHDNDDHHANDDDHHHKKKDKDKNSKSTQSGNPAPQSDQGSKGTATTPSTNQQCDNVLWGDYCYVQQQ